LYPKRIASKHRSRRSICPNCFVVSWSFAQRVHTYGYKHSKQKMSSDATTTETLESTNGNSISSVSQPLNDHPVKKDDDFDASNDEDEEEEEEDDENNDDDSVVSAPLAHLTLMNEEGIERMKLEEIAELVKTKSCNKIIVLSGAGVSVSAGIPDFRTPGTGLYDNLQKYDLPFPEAVFDLGFYRYNPQPFVSLARELWPGTSGIKPTLSHSFIRLLEEKDVLLRNYTQNIDGLEVLAGVSPEKMVECHGHFRSAGCVDCKAPYDGELCKRKILEGTLPLCTKCGGLVKPDIVFFGESLPSRFGRMIQSDLREADMLIVMGTSLKVAPVSLIPEIVDDDAPRLLLNRDLVGDFCQTRENMRRDVWEEGDCDVSVKKFCDLLGWTEELHKINKHS